MFTVTEVIKTADEIWKRIVKDWADQYEQALIERVEEK